MAQFDVFVNQRASQLQFPYLLDVQSDLLNAVATRVVVPLSPAALSRNRPLPRLSPVLAVKCEPYLMMTLQLAVLDLRALGEPVEQLARCRADILAALDMLFTGA